MTAYAHAALAALALLLSGCPRAAAPSAAGAVGRPELFTAWIEQDGRSVSLADGQARLARKPFTIVISLPEWGGVMVNASLKPDLYEAVRSGRGVDAVLPVPRQGLAEDLFNPMQRIFINDEAYNYWYYLGEKTHCFDSMEEAAGRAVCRRLVRTYGSDRDSQVAPISDLPGSALYLTLVKADLQGKKRVPRHAEAVKILFE